MKVSVCGAKEKYEKSSDRMKYIFYNNYIKQSIKIEFASIILGVYEKVLLLESEIS